MLPFWNLGYIIYHITILLSNKNPRRGSERDVRGDERGVMGNMKTMLGPITSIILQANI